MNDYVEIKQSVNYTVRSNSSRLKGLEGIGVNKNIKGVITMTNQDRIEKLKELMVNIVIIKRGLEKERNLNKKPDKAEHIKQEVIVLAREVDKVIGKQGQIESEVIEGFRKYTMQKKMGINNQIKCIIERIQDVIEILGK